jgi:hypothetical protein
MHDQLKIINEHNESVSTEKEEQTFALEKRKLELRE